MTLLCQHHNDIDVKDCLGQVDARYTMDYGDVAPGAKIYWCSNCGPGAHAMEAAILKAFETRPGFAEELEAAIEKVTQ